MKNVDLLINHFLGFFTFRKIGKKCFKNRNKNLIYFKSAQKASDRLLVSLTEKEIL